MKTDYDRRGWSVHPANVVLDGQCNRGQRTREGQRRKLQEKRDRTERAVRANGKKRKRLYP